MELESAHEEEAARQDLAALGCGDLDRNVALVAGLRRKPGLGLDPALHEVGDRVARDELEERLFDVVALYDVRGFGEGVAVEFLHEGRLLFDGDGLDDRGIVDVNGLQGTASESESGPYGR